VLTKRKRSVAGLFSFVTKVHKMNSSSSSSASNGNGSTESYNYYRMVSLKELTRSLCASSEQRKSRGVVTRQSTNSLKKKRWFDEMCNMNESRREKRKNTQTKYNQSRAKRQKIVQEGSGGHIGNVNADASKFWEQYDLRTQFSECGICGSDEGLINLKVLDDKVMSLVEESDLPSLYAAVVESLQRDGCVHTEYIRCLRQEFHRNGLLKSARYVCKTCLSGLKKKKNDSLQSSVNACSSNDDRYARLLRECGFVDTDDEDEDDEDDDEDNDEDSTSVHSDEMNIGEEVTAACATVKWCVPQCAYIQGLYPGIVPSELKDLRVVEMSMISIYNPITRLKLNGKGMSYKYFHGHAHTYNIVNDLTAVAAHLPWIPSLNTFAILKYSNDVCVKELRYRPSVVRRALTWLKKNNHLYKDVCIVYPDDWAALNADAELEPESMVIDAVEEEEVRLANDIEQEEVTASDVNEDNEQNECTDDGTADVAAGTTLLYTTSNAYICNMSMYSFYRYDARCTIG